MSEIKNGSLGLYGAEHAECNCVMTLGFKGLMYISQCPSSNITTLHGCSLDCERRLETLFKSLGPVRSQSCLGLRVSQKNGMSPS